MQERSEQITVYGTDWCGVTAQARRHLDSLGVAYRYVDIEQDPAAAAWVTEHNDGMELKPTIDVDGEVLGAPPHDALEGALRRHGVLT